MTGEINPLQAFDKQTLKHFVKPVNTFRGTRAALVKGLDVYVGIAQCVDFDQFNRRKGRAIAQGRALQAWKEDAGITSASTRRHAGSFYYKVTATSLEDVEKLLVSHIFLNEPKPVK